MPIIVPDAPPDPVVTRETMRLRLAAAQRLVDRGQPIDPAELAAALALT